MNYAEFSYKNYGNRTMQTERKTLKTLTGAKKCSRGAKNAAPNAPEERGRFFVITKTLLLMLPGSNENFYKNIPTAPNAPEEKQKLFINRISNSSQMLNGCSRGGEQPEEQFFTLKNSHFYRFAPHNPYNNNNIIIIYRGLYIEGGLLSRAREGEHGSNSLTEVAA